MSAALAEEDPPVAATPTYEYDDEFQTKIVALTLRDTIFAQRTDGLVAPEYFTNEAEASLVRIALDYYGKYKKAPDRALWGTLLKDAIAAKRIRKDMIDDVKAAVKAVVATDVSDRDFVVDQVATFARYRAVENALMNSVGALEKRNFDQIIKDMKLAVDVGIAEDEGAYDYAEEIKNRTEIRKEIAAGTLKRDGITTGCPELDKLLYHHGWGRKELSVWMAPAKGGKSTALADNALAAWLAGYNVLYLTLEVSAKITADRMDASLSDTMMKELASKPFEVEKKIEALKAKAGILKIHEYATGTLKASALRRLIERYRARGITFDLVIVDYADIMAPETRVENLQENSKSIYVDLRAVGFEYNCAMVTATQTNRDGAKAMTSTMTDVAEDFNKIRIADIVISINSSVAERSAGEARLYFAAVRNGEDGITLRIKQDRSKMKFIKSVIGLD